MEIAVKKDDEGRVVQIREKEMRYCNAGSGNKDWYDVGSITEFSYNKEGQIIKESERSPFHAKTKTRKFKDGQLMQERVKSHRNANYNNSPYGFYDGTTQYRYDEQGRIISQDWSEKYHQNFENRDFEYDEQGRLSKERISGNNYDFVDHYEYGSDGQLAQIVSYNLDENGSEIPESKSIRKVDLEGEIVE